MIAGVILFLVVLAVRLTYNIILWNKGKEVKHLPQFWITAGFLVPSMLILSSQLTFSGWLSVALCVVMVGCWFTSLFNGLYNVIRRLILVRKYGKYNLPAPDYLSWFYLKQSDANDKSEIDEIWLKFPKWVYIVSQTVPQIITAILYYINV